MTAISLAIHCMIAMVNGDPEKYSEGGQRRKEAKGGAPGGMESGQ